MKTITVEMTEEQIKDAARQLGMVELDKTSEKPRRFRAELNDSYWYLTSSGIPQRLQDIRDEWDDFRYSYGNYFKTEEEAQAHKDKLLATQRIKDKLIEFGGDEIDWNHPCQRKYFIVHIKNKNSIKIDNSIEYNSGVPCTVNKDAVTWVINNMQDDIKLMLGVE